MVRQRFTVVIQSETACPDLRIGAPAIHWLRRCFLLLSGDRPWRAPADSEEWGVKELVELMVKSLVDKPDEVVVTEVEGRHSAVIELKVAREDIGKVIGKKGAHAQALRTIISAAGGKRKKRYVLEILEER